MWLSRRQPSQADRQLRHTEPLGPMTVEIAAPREVVFDVIAAPYRERTPRAMANKLRVLDRGSDLVVADHFTPIFGGRLLVTTRETVSFDEPRRIGFRLLQGPVASVDEEYLLEAISGRTRFTYRGHLGSDLRTGGRWWARTNARTWTAVVRRSIHEITAEAERRAQQTRRESR